MSRLLLTLAVLLASLIVESLRRQSQSQSPGSDSSVPVVKNGKLKAWAATNILNLEHQKCKRRSYSLTHKSKWPWQKCPKGWTSLVFGCRTCNGGDEGHFRCWEKCGAGNNLPHLPQTCANMYCVASKSACKAAVTELVMPWAVFSSNLITNSSALEQAASSAKAIAKEGVKDLPHVLRELKGVFSTALKDSVDKLVADTRDRLLNCMKGKKAPNKLTEEAIIRGGAEVVAMQAAGIVNTKLKEYADKFLAATDFSGVPGFNKALQAFDSGENCADVTVSPIPDDAIEPEDEAEDEAAKDEAAKDEAAKDEAAKDEAAKDEAAKDEAAKDEAAKDEAARDEAAKDEAARDEAAKDEAAKDEAAKDEAAKDEAAKDEAARDEAATDEAAKDEAAKDEAAKDEAAKDEAAKVEAANDDAKLA